MIYLTIWYLDQSRYITLKIVASFLIFDESVVMLIDKVKEDRLIIYLIY